MNRLSFEKSAWVSGFHCSGGKSHKNLPKIQKTEAKRTGSKQAETYYIAFTNLGNLFPLGSLFMNPNADPNISTHYDRDDPLLDCAGCGGPSCINPPLFWEDKGFCRSCWNAYQMPTRATTHRNDPEKSENDVPARKKKPRKRKRRNKKHTSPPCNSTEDQPFARPPSPDYGIGQEEVGRSNGYAI